jgi:hypothetical protein
VLDYLPGDPGHVRWFPSEHIFICLEESNELEFLLRRKVGPNIGDLIGVSWINSDGLGSLVPSCNFLGLRNIIGFVHDCHLVRSDLVDP